jgi:hypothetical protein
VEHIGLVPDDAVGQEYALAVTAELGESRVFTTAVKEEHRHPILEFFLMIIILAILCVPVLVIVWKRWRSRMEPD